MDSCLPLTKEGPLVSANIINNIVLDTPFDEIQLCQRCMNFLRCPRYDVWKLCRSAKGVKQFFTVTIQTRLICTMNGKQFTVGGRVRCVIFFSVIRDKPFKVSQ
jgi:hypothetical protein